MEPTLSDGDWVLARNDGRARVGDVVVLEHPERSGELLITKRVHRVEAGGYWLLGDNPGQSTDSRHFGLVPHVIGPVIWRVRPWGRVH